MTVQQPRFSPEVPEPDQAEETMEASRLTPDPEEGFSEADDDFGGTTAASLADFDLREADPDDVAEQNAEVEPDEEDVNDASEQGRSHQTELYDRLGE